MSMARYKREIKKFPMMRIRGDILYEDEEFDREADTATDTSEF
jgi:hypothetical protein